MQLGNRDSVSLRGFVPFWRFFHKYKRRFFSFQMRRYWRIDYKIIVSFAVKIKKQQSLNLSCLIEKFFEKNISLTCNFLQLQISSNRCNCASKNNKETRSTAIPPVSPFVYANNRNNQLPNNRSIPCLAYPWRFCSLSVVFW